MTARVSYTSGSNVRQFGLTHLETIAKAVFGKLFLLRAGALFGNGDPLDHAAANTIPGGFSPVRTGGNR